MLHERLITIEELQTQFAEYQLSYNKLVVELGRRLQYREAAENVVRGMIDQLAAMTEGSCPGFFYGDFRPSEIYFCGFPLPPGPFDDSIEEREIRAAFHAEQGSNLPADLCLCVENMPTRWDVVPMEEQTFEDISSASARRENYREVLPTVDNELLAEVRLTPIQSRLPPDSIHSG